MSTSPFAGFDVPPDMFSGPELRRERDEALDELRACKAKIAAVLELIADPEQSHRMLTRKEIGRLLR